MKIAIVGGSVAGLGAALSLARQGHDVHVLERDDTPFPETPSAAFDQWQRKGAPQVRHSHAFLARLRNELRDRLPDVLEALMAAGAEELPLSNALREGIDDPSPRPGDDDLTLLACRRLTFEWVLHRIVLDTPGIHFRHGVGVQGLRTSADDPRRVCGVALRAEASGTIETLDADLVVDASGRRSRLPRWMEEAGLSRPREDAEPCGIFYVTRFYRLLPDATPPTRETTVAMDLGYLKLAVFHGDSGIFSITLAAAPEDKPLRALLRTEPFSAAVESLPALTAWIDPSVAEPIGDVQGMDSLRNVRRHFREGGQPIATGLVAIGDAAIHTNPLYGRGCTLALLNAFLLSDAVATHGDDLVAIANAVEDGSERELVPWYQLALTQDRQAREVAAQLRAGPKPAGTVASGNVVDPKAYMRDLLQRGLVPALRLDATVLRTFMRFFNLLAPPTDLMQDPDILKRVLAVYQTREEREEPVLGPGRSEMIGILSAAA